MSGMNWDQMTPEERLLAEQAMLNFRELNKVCDAAADGTVLDTCETLAMQQGRELIRRTIEITLHEQAHAVEKSSLSASAPNKGRRLLREEPPSSGPSCPQADHGGGRRASVACLF